MSSLEEKLPFIKCPSCTASGAIYSTESTEVNEQSLLKCGNCLYYFRAVEVGDIQLDDGKGAMKICPTCLGDGKVSRDG